MASLLHLCQDDGGSYYHHDLLLQICGDSPATKKHQLLFYAHDYILFARSQLVHGPARRSAAAAASTVQLQIISLYEPTCIAKKKSWLLLLLLLNFLLLFPLSVLSSSFCTFPGS